ncbi:MAG: SPFH domain-containing protein [Planctomycetaceae bacterium]|nr:SPFH domain-containing protein [Planctomycetaceae bacterium]
MRWLIAMLLLVGYLTSGCFVVGSSDKAVVRRFGRAAPELRDSGLWWEPPWPLTRIDRVNVAEVRTVTLSGLSPATGELLPAARPRSPGVLTGDNNILNIRASVQFHLHPDRVTDFLYRHRDPQRLLERLLETAVAETAAECGVDYLQTAGLADLNARLTDRVQAAAEAVQLGIEVDQVTLDSVDPPTLVQADFLDVANARAEAAQARHRAQTTGEQRQSAATAEALQLIATANREAQAAATVAGSQADRFRQLVEQLNADAETSGRSYVESRDLAMQRMTAETLTAALAQVRKQWVFDTLNPVDLHLRPSRD